MTYKLSAISIKQLNFIWLFFLIFFNSCSNKNKDQTIDVEKKSDFNISAQELYSEFKSNPLSADSKYANKTIEVRGEILSVMTNGVFQGEENFVDLKGNKESLVESIRILFSKAEAEKIKSLKENTMVSVSGKFNSFDIPHVILNGTRIINVEEKNVSIDNYDYEMDAQQFYELLKIRGKINIYANKIIKISGNFSNITSVNENKIRFNLFVEEYNGYIFCDSYKQYSDKLKSFKKNDRIVIIGKCNDNMFDPTLNDCIFP